MPHPPFVRGLLVLSLLASGAARGEVFVNEVHYDNAGGDVGEGVEVVATAGENLSAYRLSLYNGSGSPSAATRYDDRAVPVGSPANCGGSARIATVAWPSNGLQNGAGDGIALVDGSGQVVQFVSYEGAITAGDGPAAGRSSVDLPVAESSGTASGTSLQLAGSGAAASDFSWSASQSESFGACNPGQSFSGDTNEPPAVIATDPQDGATSVPQAAEFSVTFSEPVSASSGAFDLACEVGGNVPLNYPGGPADTFTLVPTRVLEGGGRCTLHIEASALGDAGGLHPAADVDIGFTVAAGSGGGSGYYARVNDSSPAQLRCSLHDIIRDHTAYPYSGGTTNTWTILEIADQDPADPDRVVDVYRNRSYARVADRAGSGGGLRYNREHTWPNSLGFSSSTGDRGLPYAPYTDTHMLYLADSTYNGDRGNKPYADCGSNCGERPTESNDGRGGGSGTYPGNSNWVQSPDGNGGSFETWGARKGDVARAVMYMAIRYEGGADTDGQSEPDLELTDDRSRIVKTSASPAYMGLLSTLLTWSQTDPPDAAERARNEVIFSFQGNRNPFVDHPEWASAALFNSTQPASCQPAQGR